VIVSSVPFGGGVSSSASLQVAVYTFLDELTNQQHDKISKQDKARLFVYLILPVSLDCSFLIAPSVFSNVYLHIRVFYLQSSRRAWSDLAVSDISWSMIPSGRPINACKE
jgi:hypothetical protein